jgi:hypothetical protein
VKYDMLFSSLFEFLDSRSCFIILFGSRLHDEMDGRPDSAIGVGIARRILVTSCPTWYILRSSSSTTSEYGDFTKYVQEEG